MVLLDARVHSEHAKVIRCDIRPESVEKYRDAENGTISEKIQRVIPRANVFKTPLYFLENKYCVLKT
jgi:hypothetical protein